MQQLSVLVISASEEDHSSLAHIFRSANWRVCHVWRLRDGLELLREGEAPVAICEDRLPDGDWRTALDLAARLPCPPLLIVASRLADERLWAEVLNVGAYDLLLKPFDREEVLWVATSAWQQTLRQHAPPAGIIGIPPPRRAEDAQDNGRKRTYTHARVDPGPDREAVRQGLRSPAGLQRSHRAGVGHFERRDIA